ncbi:MAG TPA: GNAT family N-acetyltransferase [Acidimicrobiia bacterium]|nr:GNAT family N-acetyltransferase [Acidimicrobiia bacterium]
MADYEIKRIEPAEARPLRRALLHPTRPPAGVDYPADQDPDALHVGAFKDGLLVGIASVHPESVPGSPEPAAWRILDIAVEHGHRGRGVGSWLLERCLEHASSRSGALMWCTTRVGAYGFFERMGFSRMGPPIEDPEEGPQYTVFAEVPPLDRSWRLTQDAGTGP